MNFAGALFALQRGHKVKRHHWTGYWYVKSQTLVDKDGKAYTRDTVMMHTYTGGEIDIRDTSDIIYTLSSCACDDWEIVDDWNKNITQSDRYKEENKSKVPPSVLRKSSHSVDEHEEEPTFFGEIL